MVSTSRPAATAFLVSGLVLLTSCNGDRTSEPAPSGTAAAASSLGEPRTVTENVDAPWSVAFHGALPWSASATRPGFWSSTTPGRLAGWASFAAARATHRPTPSRMRRAAISSLYGD